MPKVKCPECNERFEADLKEYDEGDSIDCPECSAELIVKFDAKGKPKIVTPKEKFLEEDDEFSEDEEEAKESEED